MTVHYREDAEKVAKRLRQKASRLKKIGLLPELQLAFIEESIKFKIASGLLAPRPSVMDMFKS